MQSTQLRFSAQIDDQGTGIDYHKTFMLIDGINDNPDQIKKIAQLIGKINPDKAYLAFQRIRDVLFHIGNFGEVESIFQKLLKKDSKNDPVRFALADIYERKGELQRAIDLCQDCLEKDVTSIHAKRYLVKFLPRIGKQDEALKYANELIDDLFAQKEKYFACKNCGHVSEEPLWRCPNCLEWDTFVD